MRPKLVVVGGWAYPAAVLDPVRDAAGETFDVEVLPWYAGEGELRAAAERVPSQIPVLIAGWSLGASKSIEAATAIAGTRSRAVSGLILVSASPRFARGAGFIHGLDASVVRAMTLGLHRDPSGTLRRFYGDSAAPHPPIVPLERLPPAASRDGPEGLGAGLDYLLRTDLRAACRALRLPCRVLHGREDRIIPWEAGAWIGAAVEGASISLYDGVGHDLLLRRPGLLREAAHEILDRL